MAEPRWMSLARNELGVAEIPGAKDNPKVMRYYRDAGHRWVKHDEIAWCAAFVSACIERAGIASARSLRARDYLKWGQRLRRPRIGCITVLSRGSNPAYGHVGFYVRETTSRVYLLGGNQGNKVRISAYAKSRLLGYRWPVGDDTGGPPKAKLNRASTQPSRTFKTALAHVLDMEGGWTDDPFDPGGATNKGITIARFAQFQGTKLNAANLSVLKRKLKRISDATVRTIYFKSYWLASKSDRLPAPLAFMHFDASVNQGKGRSSRLLQEALGVDIDGEIGPLTLAAAQAADIGQVLQTYADLRRRHYRSLKHFWRFGRGWLRRLERTLTSAQSLIGTNHQPSPASPNIQSNQQKEKFDMSETKKWWGQSLTIWGTLVTALSTVLPIIAPILGFNITGGMIEQFGKEIAVIIQALGGVAGTVMAILGRLRASTQLARRNVSLML